MRRSCTCTPVLAVVTNIDADHMETYGHDFGEAEARVRRFRAAPAVLRRRGAVHRRSARARDPARRSRSPIVTYGLAEDAQLRAVDVAQRGGRMRFVAHGARRAPTRRGAQRSPACTTCRTRSRRSPSAAKSACADAAIARALAEFKGVGRRFQRYGDVALAGGGTFTLIDDYGHHPAEMAATLAAARESFPGRRLVLAFQPHRYTRTRDLFEDFVRVLSTVDALRAGRRLSGRRGADRRRRRPRARARGARRRPVEPVFVETIGDVAAAIRDVARDGDVVVTMGAGSIGSVPAQLAPSRAGANDDAASPLALRRPARHARARRAARAAHELALSAAPPICSTRRPIATTSRSSCAACRADDAGDRARARQQPAGARRRHSRHGRAAARPGRRARGRRRRSIYAEAGVASPKLARFAAMHGCADAEFLAGIPGTVGGALAMNAGCYGGETWTLRRARRDADARRRVRRRARRPTTRSAIAASRIATAARSTSCSRRRGFAFRRATSRRRAARIKALLARRIATQPLALPNAGSVFRNPPGDHAARLIEACGLKGYRDRRRARVGEARELHRQPARRGERGRHRGADRARARRRCAATPASTLEPEVRMIGESRRRSGRDEHARLTSARSPCCWAARRPSARSRSCPATRC